MADRLRRELRGYAGIGRYGGEEFVVILDRLTLSQGQLIADRLRTAISVLPLDHDLQITVSIGLAHYQPDHPRNDLHQLLARADAALYEAKTSGRDRVQTGSTLPTAQGSPGFKALRRNWFPPSRRTPG